MAVVSATRESRSELCLECLLSWLGWTADMLYKWLGMQDESLQRQRARKRALSLWWHDGIPTGIYQYAEQYGVWLVQSDEIEAVLAMRQPRRER